MHWIGYNKNINIYILHINVYLNMIDLLTHVHINKEKLQIEIKKNSSLLNGTMGFQINLSTSQNGYKLNLGNILQISHHVQVIHDIV